MSIAEKLNKINENIKRFATSANVKLVAVSKYAEDSQVLEAEKLGVNIFAENYVSPALEKMARLKDRFTGEVAWHLTGTLQKNKVNKAVGNFALIQSVDSISLLERIDSRSKNLAIKQEVLIQINVSASPSKHGFSVAGFQENLDKIFSFENVEEKGLMTMFEKEESESSFRQQITVMNDLKNLLQSKNPDNEFDLSMGMSSDYCEALSGGASMIRIGRELFG